MRGLCTGTVPRSGRIGLVYFDDHRGRIVTEMSMVRFATDEDTCRRVLLARHFELEVAEGPCGACDACAEKITRTRWGRSATSVAC